MVRSEWRHSRLFLIGSHNWTRSPRPLESPNQLYLFFIFFLTRESLKMSILNDTSIGPERREAAPCSVARHRRSQSVSQSVSVYTEEEEKKKTLFFLFVFVVVSKWNGFASVALNPMHTFCSLLSWTEREWWMSSGLFFFCVCFIVFFCSGTKKKPTTTTRTNRTKQLNHIVGLSSSLGFAPIKQHNASEVH